MHRPFGPARRYRPWFGFLPETAPPRAPVMRLVQGAVVDVRLLRWPITGQSYGLIPLHSHTPPPVSVELVGRVLTGHNLIGRRV